MGQTETIIKLVVSVVVITIIGVFFNYMAKPKKKAKTYNNIVLSETEENSSSDDPTSTIMVIDNIEFDLDNYEPKDEFEETYIRSMKNNRYAKAVAMALDDRLDNMKSDRIRLAKYFRKAKFYETKGEYAKAIRVLVKLLQNDIKSPLTKERAYNLLARYYARLGVPKQKYKALMRYYEIKLSMTKDPSSIKELKAMKSEMEQKMNAIN